MLSRILKWARVAGTEKSGKQYPVQRVDYLGKIADAAMLYPYGLHANVPVDELTLIASVQGNSENRVTLGCLQKNRPALDVGEVAIFNGFGLLIKMQSNGEMIIKSDVKIKIEAPETEFTGVVKANGSVIDDTHGHAQGSDSAGDVQQDISGVL